MIIIIKPFIVIFSDNVILPLNVKAFMLYYDKPVFIYPQLLPTRTYHHEFKHYPIGPSEEKYYILCYFSWEGCTSIFTLFVSLMCKMPYYLKKLLINYL